MFSNKLFSDPPVQPSKEEIVECRSNSQLAFSPPTIQMVEFCSCFVFPGSFIKILNSSVSEQYITITSLLEVKQDLIIVHGFCFVPVKQVGVESQNFIFSYHLQLMAKAQLMVIPKILMMCLLLPLGE